MQQWDGEDRRADSDERRIFSERRFAVERRFDYRDSTQPARRSIKSWMRSLSNARLGVDRRKGVERRLHDKRRSEELRSLLTPEELAALLQD